MVKGSDDDSHSAGSGGGFFSRILSAVMPSAKAVGAGAAGEPLLNELPPCMLPTGWQRHREN
jgi:hypothetical protein